MLTNDASEIRDQDLLAAIAGGDLDAFHQFYLRHAGRVVAYARRLSGDHTLAEDVAQEVFTAVWRKAGTYRPDCGGPAPWLYTLTRNKLVDLWRRAGRPTDALDDGALPAVPPAASDLRLALDQALARVNPDQRRAIELAYFHGLTYEETAGRLALPLGTLKSRIRLGLQTLREVLESPPWPSVSGP